MTTITLEVPDELALRLNPLREQLPLLLEQAINSLWREKGRSNGKNHPVDSASTIYSEVLAFLSSGPTLKQIAEFKVSQPLQDRVEELLDRNREEGLTEPERVEMDTYLRVSHVMTMLKIHARASMTSALQ